jgi:hypothetical protein
VQWFWLTHVSSIYTMSYPASLKDLIFLISLHLSLIINTWSYRTLRLSPMCTILWMVRDLVSQIDSKKELKFWTTLIIVLLKEQSTVYIHRTRKIAPTVSIIHKEIKEYNNNLWEKCLSVSSKVHVAERKILQVRYLTYGWLFYKVHLPPPEKCNIFLVYCSPWSCFVY